jgi:pseudouridine synthase
MERLPKLLARAGLGSRRASERIIAEGRVTVDGQIVADPSAQVDEARSLVRVDGRLVRVAAARRYLLLNKPPGLLTARRDDFGRPTVMECLPAEWHAHVFPVGRLDKDTTGLLLLTDDGDLAYRCLHPSHHVPKTYRVTVARAPSEKSLRQLRQGVELEDGVTAPAEVWLKRATAEGAQVEITIREGRNRQVRRMFGAVGHPVLALERVSMGPLHLGGLARGEWRELREEEVRELREACEL